MASSAVTPLQGLLVSANGLLCVYQPASISDIIIDSCRGYIYCSLVYLLSFHLDVTLLEGTYTSRCVAHRTRVSQVHQSRRLQPSPARQPDHVVGHPNIQLERLIT